MMALCCRCCNWLPRHVLDCFWLQHKASRREIKFTALAIADQEAEQCNDDSHAHESRASRMRDRATNRTTALSREMEEVSGHGAA